MGSVINEYNNEKDIETRTSIMNTFESGDYISIPLIQRKCRTGYNTASRTLQNLLDDGIVEGENVISICKML